MLFFVANKPTLIVVVILILICGLVSLTSLAAQGGIFYTKSNIFIKGRLLSPLSIDNIYDNNNPRFDLTLLTSKNDQFELFERKICDAMQKNVLRIKPAQHVTVAYRKKKCCAFIAYVTLAFALENIQVSPDLWLEFGVNNGYSVNLTTIVRSKMYPNNNNRIFGFDSFVGLPTTFAQGTGLPLKAGMFSQNGILPAVRKNVVLIKGWFNETLPKFLEQYKNNKVSYVNIDNDLYEGSKYLLQHITPRLTRGSMLHFHELIYYNKTKSCHGLDELKALYENLARFPKLKLLILQFTNPVFVEPVVFLVL